MKITELTELELLQGISTLVFVFISFIIGFIFFIKYISTKRIEHISLGLSWILVTSAWWGTTFSFLSILFINEPLNDIIFISIGNIFMPVALIFWIFSMSHLMYPNKEKVIVLVFLIICVPYDISIIILMLINPSLIGKKIATFNYAPSPYVMVFQIFAVSIVLISGIIFSIKSLRMDNRKLKIHAKFLLIAFISFSIASFLDAVTSSSEILLLFIRLILISSGIEYYFGFFLPKRLMRIFIEE